MSLYFRLYGLGWDEVPFFKMKKKCIICGEEAKYNIKNSNECYCDDCSHEHFADISYLQKIEDEVKIIKKILDEKVPESDEDNEDNDDKSEAKDNDDKKNEDFSDVDVKFVINGKKK